MRYSYNTTNPELENPILGPGSILVLGPLITTRTQIIAGSVWVDQSGTLYVEQSFDGENWDASASFPINVATPGTGESRGFTQSVVAPNVRVRYINGTTIQGAMRIFFRAMAQSVRV